MCVELTMWSISVVFETQCIGLEFANVGCGIQELWSTHRYVTTGQAVEGRRVNSEAPGGISANLHCACTHGINRDNLVAGKHSVGVCTV